MIIKIILIFKNINSITLSLFMIFKKLKKLKIKYGKAIVRLYYCNLKKGSFFIKKCVF